MRGAAGGLPAATNDVRFVLVGQCEADPQPSSFAPGSHGEKCASCAETNIDRNE